MHVTFPRCGSAGAHGLSSSVQKAELVFIEVNSLSPAEETPVPNWRAGSPRTPWCCRFPSCSPPPEKRCAGVQPCKPPAPIPASPAAGNNWLAFIAGGRPRLTGTVHQRNGMCSDRGAVQWVAVIGERTSTDRVGRSANATGGGMKRRGPANGNGEARSENTVIKPTATTKFQRSKA